MNWIDYIIYGLIMYVAGLVVSYFTLNRKAERRIVDALEIVYKHGGHYGETHHQAWCMDQVVRTLCGSEEEYAAWVREYCEGEEGPDTYEWNTGIAP